MKQQAVLVGIAAVAGAALMFTLDHLGLTGSSPSVTASPRSDAAQPTRLKSPASPQLQMERTVKAPSLPAPGMPPPQSELGSRAWLVGAWGPNVPSHVAKIEACDTDGIVVFSSDGTYHDGASSGRYRYDGRKVTYYDRVLEDEAEGTEDRSEYNQPLTAIIKPIGPNVMSEDGLVAYRCDAG